MQDTGEMDRSAKAVTRRRLSGLLATEPMSVLARLKMRGKTESPQGIEENANLLAFCD